MTEKLSTPNPEKEPLDVTTSELIKKPEHSGIDNATHESSNEDLEHIRAKIEKSSLKTHEITVDSLPQQSGAPLGLHRELKQQAYEHTLKRIQGRLRAPERAFSRFVHLDAVEKISGASAQTIARPSGILGGGFAGLVGSAFLLYTAKRYGFEYNYFVFIVLYVCGFVAGLIVEIAVRLWNRRKI